MVPRAKIKTIFSTTRANVDGKSVLTKVSANLRSSLGCSVHYYLQQCFSEPKNAALESHDLKERGWKQSKSTGGVANITCFIS